MIDTASHWRARWDLPSQSEQDAAYNNTEAASCMSCAMRTAF